MDVISDMDVNIWLYRLILQVLSFIYICVIEPILSYIAIALTLSTFTYLLVVQKKQREKALLALMGIFLLHFISMTLDGGYDGLRLGGFVMECALISSCAYYLFGDARKSWHIQVTKLLVVLGIVLLVLKGLVIPNHGIFKTLNADQYSINGYNLMVVRGLLILIILCYVLLHLFIRLKDIDRNLKYQLMILAGFFIYYVGFAYILLVFPQLNIVDLKGSIVKSELVLKISFNLFAIAAVKEWSQLQS